MASIGLGFTLSANAAQMASGINAGVTELQKLGYAAKKTQADVATLKAVELSRAFISSVQTAASAFNTFVSGSAAAVASLDDLSKRTGVSTQTLQAYQFVADQSGVSVEAFGKSIQKLGVNLGEAQTGNKTAAQAFGDLGISVQELARLAPDQAFERVAAAISELPNPAQQAAAAVSLFGKSGTELVPVFQEGVQQLLKMKQEAIDLGLVLGDRQVASLAKLDDSIGKLRLTFKAVKDRVAAELAPALLQASESARQFLISLDVQAVAKSAETAVAAVADVARSLGTAFSEVYTVMAPLLRSALQPTAEVLGFIASNIKGAAIGASAAAVGFGAYSLACGAAAIATGGLSAAVTALLSRTGIGLVAVVIGIAGEAFIEYAQAGTDSSAQVQQSVADVSKLVKQNEETIKSATKAAREFGAEAAVAFKLPAEITQQTIIQGVIDEATQGFRKIAQEAGSIAAVPKELVDAFDVLKKRVGSLTDEFKNAAFSEESIAEAARNVARGVENITKQREAEKKATEAVADAARKASEEAAKRVAELAQLGVTDGEKSRLQYTQDLLAIQQTIADAEREIAAARLAGDLQAVSAAEKRLQLARETAGVATDAARQQKRDRDLAALGLDKNLTKPIETVTDQFKRVRAAFDRGLINGGEARAALQNLAAEGIAIRKEIAAELAKPSQQALTVSDVRTQAGASEFLRLATGRADPAIEQRAQQLAKLEEIRRGLVAIGLNPVDILGA